MSSAATQRTEEITRLAKSSIPLRLDAEMTRVGLVHTGCFWQGIDSSKPGPILATYTTSYNIEPTPGAQVNHTEGRLDCWIIKKDPRPHSDELPIEVIDEASEGYAGWAINTEDTPKLAAWTWADTGRVLVAGYNILSHTVNDNWIDWGYNYTRENGIYHRGADYFRFSRLWVPASVVWTAMNERIEKIMLQIRDAATKDGGSV